MRISLSLLAIAPLLASTALFAACSGGTVTGVDEPTPDAGNGNGSSSSSSSSGGGDGGSSGEPAPFGLPSIGDLPKDKFSFLKPAGDTVCALGGEYGFAIRPGDPTKVVVEFEGGGACWNETTCAGPATGGGAVYFKDFVRAEGYTGDEQVGLRDHGNGENPVQGWTHVIVPYCSADVHWGDKESTYPGDIKIQHRGAKNTDAVLQYMYSQVKAPERMFVTGCSAGGYGSIYWTPKLRAHYTSTALRHFSDSAAGVFPESYFSTLSDAWGFQSTFPTDIGSAGDFKNLAYLYQGIADTYSDVRLSQYNTLTDQTQRSFLLLMGGTDWSAGMRSNIGTLIDGIPSFREYMSPGDVHCIIEKDDFYSKEVEGTKLTTWLGKMVKDEAIENVNCPACTIP